MADINESFGEMGEATFEERVEAGRRLAATLVEKLPKGLYTFKLKTQKNEKAPNGEYVTVYVNAKAGERPGRLSIGKFATPILFPEDETDAEKFINVVDAAGIKLKVYTQSEA